jgi:hypothetical protein
MATMVSSSGFVDELHVEQVEVDEVGVHPVVGDLPELGAVMRGFERCSGSGWLEDLGRRVQILERDRHLDQGAGVR